VQPQPQPEAQAQDTAGAGDNVMVQLQCIVPENAVENSTLALRLPADLDPGRQELLVPLPLGMKPGEKFMVNYKLGSSEAQPDSLQQELRRPRRRLRAGRRGRGSGSQA